MPEIEIIFGLAFLLGLFFLYRFLNRSKKFKDFRKKSKYIEDDDSSTR